MFIFFSSFLMVIVSKYYNLIGQGSIEDCVIS